VPGHLDGAGGLKAIGDYFIYQAFLLSLPALFLAAWSLLFFVPELGDRYQPWRGIYVSLFLISVLGASLAVVGPLWAVHRRMNDVKRSRLAEAEEKLAEVASLRERLQAVLSKDERETARDRLTFLTQAYIDCETMPTWPLNLRQRRKLTVANFAVLLPLAARIVELARDS
jgi:hypothetical protein